MTPGIDDDSDAKVFVHDSVCRRAAIWSDTDDNIERGRDNITRMSGQWVSQADYTSVREYIYQLLLDQQYYILLPIAARYIQVPSGSSNLMSTLCH
jgi:hypothetical protein